MATASYAIAGSAGFGPSRVYLSLPYAGYRELDAWIVEFVDALGNIFEVLNHAYISAGAKANLLDATYVPSQAISDELAIQTAAPVNAASTDAMVDMLCFLAGIPTPVNTHITATQKQALALAGAEAMKRKGARPQLLNIGSKISDGIVYGWSLPPYFFSHLLSDGEPQPGWGDWVVPLERLSGTVATTSGSPTVSGTSTAFQADPAWIGLGIVIGTNVYYISSVTNATTLTLTANASANASGVTAYIIHPYSARPWLYRAEHEIILRFFPAWSFFGAGVSQFRAGFSAAGEPVGPEGARLCIFAGEHFDAWSGGLLTDWTESGSGTLTQNTTIAQISREFTNSAAQIDLSAASVGVGMALIQSAVKLNNQRTHRFQVDYAYSNAQLLNSLTARIYDDSQASTVYWNPDLQKWQTTIHNIELPQSSTAGVGTIGVTANSTDVAGTNTNFDPSYEGLMIKAGLSGAWHTVSRFVSPTTLTLATSAAATASGALYRTMRKRYACDVVPQANPYVRKEIGTISLTLNSATVNGTSTDFDEDWEGTQIRVGTSTWYTVDTVASTTSLTITTSAASTESGAFTRTHAMSTTVDTKGQNTIAFQLAATSDGTDTTKQVYTLYRAGLYEKFDLDIEQEAGGERTLWLPLVDSLGWTTTAAGAGTNTLLEMATYDRSLYKTIIASAPLFSYHPAISSRGYRARGFAWTNRVLGSNDFNTDWTLNNATFTASSQISPIVGETVATAPLLTATSTGAYNQQATGYSPTSRSFVAGVWVKKLSTDANFTDVTLSLISTTTKSIAFTLTQAQGWQLLAMPAQTFDGSDLANLTFRIAWGAASTSGQIAVASSYVYDVTSNTGVQYPPICQTAVGATGTVATHTLAAATSGSDVLHPFLKRSLVSVVRGLLSIKVIPTFDGTSQPNGTIFEAKEDDTQNVIRLSVISGVLTATLIDDTPTTYTAGLTMVNVRDPSSTQVTWIKDELITILVRWDLAFLSLAAAGSSVITAISPAHNASDASLDSINIGGGVANFDGHIFDVEVLQVGAPAA